MMKSRFAFVLLAVALLCATVGIATADPDWPDEIVPSDLTYQGMLTDATGNPLNGLHAFRFRLYLLSNPAEHQWLRQEFQTLNCTNGFFSTTLPFGTSLFYGNRAWLGITVDGDNEMRPLQEIRPVPYALALRPGSYMRAIDSWGFSISTIGVGGRGLNVNTTNTASPGVYAETWGDSSQGFAANTYGTDSPGIDVKGWGTDSPGVRAGSISSNGIYAYTHRTDNMYSIFSNDIIFSRGIHLETTGTGHEGARIKTTGSNSDGIYVENTGSNSYGVNVSTTQFGSPGFFAETTGGSSQGLAAVTFGDNSPAIDVSTSGLNSHGAKIKTTGPGSFGVDIKTEDTDSPGVYAVTYGDNSQGFAANTQGTNSPVVDVKAWGADSYGVKAASVSSSAIYAETSDPGSFGLITPNKISVEGIVIPGVADVAEYMPVTENVTPGTVLVIGKGGILQTTSTAYDTHVAGIVSTSPGVFLGSKSSGGQIDALIAVSGRVPCRVDTTNGPIMEGDLLTTSSIPGFAMRAEPVNIDGIEIYRPGTILGKAMGTLESGTGIIEVLVTLQ